MLPDAVVLSRGQKILLAQLCACIPDLDSENPETMRRIFSLGLYALSRQVICQARASGASHGDLMILLKKMIEK